MKKLLCLLFFSAHVLFALEIDKSNGLTQEEFENTITLEYQEIPLETSQLNTSILESDNNISKDAIDSEISLANQQRRHKPKPVIKPEPSTFLFFILLPALMLFRKKVGSPCKK